MVEKVPSGTVSEIPVSGRTILAPSLVTVVHLVNGEEGRRVVSKVPPLLGEIFPPVEEEEESERRGFAKESTGLRDGRRTIGCS